MTRLQSDVGLVQQSYLMLANSDVEALILCLMLRGIQAFAGSGGVTAGDDELHDKNCWNVVV